MCTAKSLTLMGMGNSMSKSGPAGCISGTTAPAMEAEGLWSRPRQAPAASSKDLLRFLANGLTAIKGSS